MKQLMWLALIMTIGSCVVVPHIGWTGFFVVWVFYLLAEKAEKQEDRIRELERERNGERDHDDYDY